MSSNTAETEDILKAIREMMGEETTKESLPKDVLELTEKENMLVEKIKPYDGSDRVKKFELRKFLLDLRDEELPKRHLINPTFNVIFWLMRLFSSVVSDDILLVVFSYLYLLLITVY